MTQDLPENTHYYASSVATWMTTTDKRTLPELITAMTKEKLGFNLFLVPVSWDTTYQIKGYQPQVEGAQWLGYFEP